MGSGFLTVLLLIRIHVFKIWKFCWLYYMRCCSSWLYIVHLTFRTWSNQYQSSKGRNSNENLGSYYAESLLTWNISKQEFICPLCFVLDFASQISPKHKANTSCESFDDDLKALVKVKSNRLPKKNALLKKDGSTGKKASCNTQFMTPTVSHQNAVMNNIHMKQWEWQSKTSKDHDTNNQDLICIQAYAANPTNAHLKKNMKNVIENLFIYYHLNRYSILWILSKKQ